MLKTKLPSALIYGWNQSGEFELPSFITEKERIFGNVKIYSCDNSYNFHLDFCLYKPDIIITFGKKSDHKILLSAENHLFIKSKWFHFEDIIDDRNLGNLIDKLANDWNCSVVKNVFQNKETPFFSVFTGAYETNDRIFRAYEGLKNQTYVNWEWIVIDDSGEENFTTWEKLKQIAETDYRVKIYKISPTSGGNVGEVKHRAAQLCNGGWLLEYDHDDYLASTYFEECIKGIDKFPEAGFIYTGYAERNENLMHKVWGPLDAEGYGKWQNTRYVWAYCYHEWVLIDGTQYVGNYPPNMNPKTIRFNIGMPNHARMWRRDIYQEIGGHNRFTSVADDYELIIKTFLATRMLKINKILYVQYNNSSSTKVVNFSDINKRSRLIRDFYDLEIHKRITELGVEDWNWDPEEEKSFDFFFMDRTRYFEREGVCNLTIN